MEFPLEQLFQLASGQSFGGAVNSILLALILLNIRSLKAAILKMEVSHDKRITELELAVDELKTVRG